MHVTYHTELMWYLTAVLGMPQSKQWPGQRVRARKKPIRKVIDGPHVALPQVCSQFIVLDDNKASLAQFISEVIMEKEKDKDLPERFELVTAVDSQMLRIQDQRGEMMSVFKQTTKRLTPGWYSIRVSQLTKITKECWSSAETQIFCFFFFFHTSAAFVDMKSTKAAEVWMLSGTAKKRKCYPTIHGVSERLAGPVMDTG